jgi:hypothetical protein
MVHFCLGPKQVGFVIARFKENCPKVYTHFTVFFLDIYKINFEWLEFSGGRWFI